MNIVIFSGGTGSINFQTELYKKFGDLLNISVLINGLDNGLSTGSIRQLFNGDILGPSDLRKNQLLHHYLRHGKSELYDLLNIRFDISSDRVLNYCYNSISHFKTSKEIYSILVNALDYYFQNTDYKSIDYTNFSFSNIIYGSLAAMNNNSLKKAGEIMENILDIPKESVILNSDESVFLRAITESNTIILNEADIVDWNNKDKIIDISFVDNSGNNTKPQIVSNQAINKIKSADIIIFSSGTQWSSLIPTYASIGIKDIIENSTAEKYFIMNNIPDKDMIYSGSIDILNLINRWIDISNFNIIYNKNSIESMKTIPNQYSTISGNYGDADSKTHDCNNMIKDIFKHYYRKFISNDYVFDYDDTLVARRNTNPKVSNLNISLINELAERHNVSICSGNSIKNINTSHLSNKIRLFCDGGIIEYTNNSKYCINESILLSNDIINIIIDIIKKIEIKACKIENRSNVMIAIRNIDNLYRTLLLSYLELSLSNYNVKIRKAGLSTIEISNINTDKAITVNFLNRKNLTYIGDEFTKSGNDYPISQKTNAKCLIVKSINDTAIFLLTILNKESEQLW